MAAALNDIIPWAIFFCRSVNSRAALIDLAQQAGSRVAGKGGQRGRVWSAAADAEQTIGVVEDGPACRAAKVHSRETGKSRSMTLPPAAAVAKYPI
jgi:hypothetical protein